MDEPARTERVFQEIVPCGLSVVPCKWILKELPLVGRLLGSRHTDFADAG